MQMKRRQRARELPACLQETSSAIHLNNVKVSAAVIGYMGRRGLKRSGVTSWQAEHLPPHRFTAKDKGRLLNN